MLVKGVWTADWQPVQKQDAQGRFIRQTSAFRDKPDVSGVETGRYELIVAYICPWATRCLIARSLLGLEKYFPLRVVHPALTEEGWRFREVEDDDPVISDGPLTGVNKMHELYTRSDAEFTGRATVPVIWDRTEACIVNNESADIVRIFNRDLRPLHHAVDDLAPDSQMNEIDQFNETIYHALNNGVYRAGFAGSQQAYNEAYADVFTCLDRLETHFSHHDYAVGDQLTESDIYLFVTLVRFDVAYFSLFKTNRNQIADFTALSAYLKRLLQIPAFAKSTRIDHIKQGYYSIKSLNPSGIIPQGPALDWLHLTASS